MNALFPVMTWETGIPRLSDDFAADTKAHYVATRLRLYGGATQEIPAPCVVEEVTEPPAPQEPERIVLPPNPIDEYLKSRVRVASIILNVSEHYNVQPLALVSERRPLNLITPRHVAIYLAKTMTTKSMPEIGRHFGGRDHTTILHACRKIERMMAADPLFADEVEQIRLKCTPPTPPAPLAPAPVESAP